MNISEIIAEGENTKIELKEIMNDKAYKTLSAFSNTEGGTFLCGVNDNGQVVGFDCLDEPVRDVTTKIVNRLGIQPSINCFEFEGKKILRIDVKKSVNPIAYRGKYYKRVGSTTMEMQGEELRNFFLKGTNWDAITGNYTLDEIDEETVDKFVNRAIKKGRLPEGQTDDLKETLKKLNLIINDKLTNAAIILFGKNPQQYFTNALIRVITFKGNINTSDKIISGNLFNQVEEAEKAIKSSLNVRHEVKGKLTRDDIWDYPLEAVRESLLNAIIHRDYFKYGIQTQIKISEDNIWFFNPGGLIGGLTIE
ncbi:MAG: putative DNA binding domain-containing protein, partial [Methanobacterium paludis]|nr:putative DNA binding domain-containing protein [Methanobacterium paludis]